MLKKCVYYVRGMIKTWVLVALLVAMIGYYFWHAQVDSFVAGRIEASKKDGIIFYTTGIWSKMKKVQNLQDERTQRALELVGNTKTISDRAGLYSFAVPETWESVSEEGSSGNQVSRIIVASPAFSQRNDGADIFFDNGAQLTIQAVRGQEASAKISDGGHGRYLVSKNSATVEGASVAYYVFKDPAVKIGELMDAYILNGNYTYHFSYAFNPDKFDGGELTFQDILRSFKIRR